MTWLSCNECGHVFTNGYFSSDAADVIFVQDYPHGNFGTIEEQRIRWAETVEKTCRFVDVGGGWLDVGFGMPSLLMTAEEWGFDPCGVDVRASSVKMAESLGIRAFQGGIECVEGDKFSVISMCDVLEHLPFPVEALKAARNLLRDGGALVVSLPAYDSPIWRVMDIVGENPYWAEIEHYHNFSRKRLFKLLDECGFTVSHYDVSKRYRACMEIIAC